MELWAGLEGLRKDYSVQNSQEGGYGSIVSKDKDTRRQWSSSSDMRGQGSQNLNPFFVSFALCVNSNVILFKLIISPPQGVSRPCAHFTDKLV